jgi:hypothetical protein
MCLITASADGEALVRLCLRYLSTIRASTSRQLAGSKIGRFFERLGFCSPNALLEGRLRRLPLGFQPPKRRLARGCQRPAPLSTIAAGSVDHKTALSDKSQGSRCGGLVDSQCIGKIGRGQVRDELQRLQHRVLRGMEAAAGEDLLVQYGHRSRRLSEGRAVTRKRLQFHGSHLE